MSHTCINNTYDLGIGRRLENLPALVQRMTETNDRYLDAQAELLDSTIDAGQLDALAAPTLVGKRRVPGIKLHDSRVIRLLAALLHLGGLVADWTTRDVHARVCRRERISEADYRLSQLRYDLSKLRAKGLVERIGKSRRYRLTPRGVKLGTLLVKLRTLLRQFGYGRRHPQGVAFIKGSLRERGLMLPMSIRCSRSRDWIASCRTRAEFCSPFSSSS